MASEHALNLQYTVCVGGKHQQGVQQGKRHNRSLSLALEWQWWVQNGGWPSVPLCPAHPILLALTPSQALPPHPSLRTHAVHAVHASRQKPTLLPVPTLLRLACCAVLYWDPRIDEA